MNQGVVAARRQMGEVQCEVGPRDGREHQRALGHSSRCKLFANDHQAYARLCHRRAKHGVLKAPDDSWFQAALLEHLEHHRVMTGAAIRRLDPGHTRQLRPVGRLDALFPCGWSGHAEGRVLDSVIGKGRIGEIRSQQKPHIQLSGLESMADVHALAHPQVHGDRRMLGVNGGDDFSDPARCRIDVGPDHQLALDRAADLARERREEGGLVQHMPGLRENKAPGSREFEAAVGANE